ncbi:uncharacterized protein LOC129952357 [Eupeodes corollae]|uniref:uncharacterized protein LOC129952357 n=1 Tax=Eupeodes corollae TaxID=290404 RepID=UPI002493AE94|nr:uncharacterized protein LOC129952357 [Eupeodes corollae]
MIRKTWHKQTHRRKIWKTYSLTDKIWYYMKPFVVHLLMVWLEPLPVPTFLKAIYSACLIVFILFPVIYPTAIILAYYWVFQFIGERDFGIIFPKILDFRGYVNKVINTDPSGEYGEAVHYYCEQLKVMAATIASLVDYVRLASSAILGIG